MRRAEYHASPTIVTLRVQQRTDCGARKHSRALLEAQPFRIRREAPNTLEGQFGVTHVAALSRALGCSPLLTHSRSLSLTLSLAHSLWRSSHSRRCSRAGGGHHLWDKKNQDRAGGGVRLFTGFCVKNRI